MNALKWSSKPSVCGASRLLASAATQAELWHWAGELSPCRNAQGNQLWLFKEIKKGQPAFAKELWNAFKQLQRCWNQKVPILCRIHFPNAFQQQSLSDTILFFSSFDWLFCSETGTLSPLWCHKGHWFWPWVSHNNSNSVSVCGWFFLSLFALF